MKPLVISLGFNGYQWIYARNVETQRAYCVRHGFDYVMVSRPRFSNMLMECAWLKIPLITAALEAGRPWVLFLDSDVEVKVSAPSFLSNETGSSDLYLANGFSGRVNSGVIIARRSERVVSLFSEMYSNAMKPIPAEDDVGWGENGHVIHYTKRYNGLQILDARWNNNFSPTLDDYFRHYSAGPMRKFYEFTLFEKVVYRAAKIYNKYLPPNKLSFNESMDLLMNSVRAAYPQAFPMPFNKSTGRSISI
ncbi:UNVERIFIED_ORG: hypothetical protein M2312_002945 [Rhizobium esperanzae]|uniref:Nucleotide-diphospho-sugar transferase domain-containing protein n=1 Tax=Rhizobium phaseoli TaxID=396 RepID=A0A192TIR1_9HYPH|nr:MULTISPECIES: hypothetical protein [Rhizobium]MDH6648289.1 hypothetical protein [Rhizobium esperanzae]ANL43088.1 hypothetical protein AMC88_PB00011 [Rhizobium phaseoli]ANL56087.1 hypothetical protein AMC86_PC00011 [Rhizobium phaseoli]ANL62074.1 hypothetical protein AMC85_PB00011 [Rhizobium phaseoli]ANL87487.1 hypothetical protein AMC81_PC00011 [Rhizobium phaseoli]